MEIENRRKEQEEGAKKTETLLCRAQSLSCCDLYIGAGVGALAASQIVMENHQNSQQWALRVEKKKDGQEETTFVRFHEEER